MKLDRRSFIKLISVTSAAMVSGCLGISWFLGQTVRGLEKGFQPTDWPIEWGPDRPTTVDLQSYRLHVVGAVSKPLHLTIDDLYAMPTVKRSILISCDMRGQVWQNDVLWEGIPLTDLLSLAGTAPETIDHIVLESVTGYKAIIKADAITDPHTMIALKAEGAPLTIEHGYPARIVHPISMASMESPHARSHTMVKYVTKLTCAAKSG